MEDLNRTNSSLLHIVPCPLGKNARTGPIFAQSMRQTGSRILKSELCIGVLNQCNACFFVIFYVLKASHAVPSSENMPRISLSNIYPRLSLFDDVVE